MTPKEFVTVLDEGRANGGALSEDIPHDYAITTAEEVNTICRVLSSPHVRDRQHQATRTAPPSGILSVCRSVGSQCLPRQRAAAPEKNID